MAAHARSKNEFTGDEKCHNLMSWLKLFTVCTEQVRSPYTEHAASGQWKKKNFLWLFDAESFNGCEVLIEYSVTRVTVRHHSEFSICTEEPLWILFVEYSSFDNCSKPLNLGITM